jgi:hypothetical protein
MRAKAHGACSERFMRHHYGASGFVERDSVETADSVIMRLRQEFINAAKLNHGVHYQSWEECGWDVCQRAHAEESGNPAIYDKKYVNIKNEVDGCPVCGNTKIPLPVGMIVQELVSIAVRLDPQNRTRLDLEDLIRRLEAGA